MSISMERWVGKVAVVTGASSGIGAAITKKLVQQGVIVIGLARRRERIEEMSKQLSKEKGKLFALKVDMSIEDEIKEAFKWILANVGPVSIVVNNAGMHYRTSLLDEHTENLRKTVDVNIMGLVIATREAIKHMELSKIDGHVVHINSILGHYIFNQTNLDIYPATKYAVTALTETLRMDLNRMGSKIKVSSVSPGVVDTEIFDNMRNTDEFKDVVSKYMLRPEDIADGVIYILSTPPHVQVQELTIKPVGQPF